MGSPVQLHTARATASQEYPVACNCNAYILNLQLKTQILRLYHTRLFIYLKSK